MYYLIIFNSVQHPSLSTECLAGTYDIDCKPFKNTNCAYCHMDTGECNVVCWKNQTDCILGKSLAFSNLPVDLSLF